VVAVGDRKLGFKNGGDTSPDPKLLAHAHEIVAAFDEFRDRVSSFLTTKAARQLHEADEIRVLEIEEVCLFWPDRPDDGMIYFTNGDKGRLWRCDYVGRKPAGLGFDS
jgi:hypothetical protein